LSDSERNAWCREHGVYAIFSRKVVGFTVEATDSADHATKLVQRIALKEGVHARKRKPVLHGNNGPTVKSSSIFAMLAWLGMTPSFSRPRVSNDNAFVEAWFRTAKYAPAFPTKGFKNLQETRIWAERFVRWYNTECRHSGIRYVTPQQRHCGEDKAILHKRHALYQQARVRNPRRWSGKTRNWAYQECVTLNPERDSVVSTELSRTQSIQCA